MKKNVLTIIAVVACALLAFDSIRIAGLKTEIDNLHSYVNNEISTVNSNINEVYGNVQDMLDKEANQLAISEWSYGEISVEKRTAQIICTMVPKVYTPGSTKLAITCDGKEYALDYSNNQYQTAIELPLFAQSEIAKVNMDDNGTIRTQELNWVIEPRYEVLPISYAGMGGSATGKPGMGEYIWSPQYAVNINIEGKKEYQIKSVELVEVLDGKEINRTSVDLSREGQSTYKEAVRKSGQAVPDIPETRANEVGGTKYEGDLHFLYYLEEDFHIKNGSMLEFYVDVVDGYGLRYRSFVDCLAITADGEPDDTRMEEKQGYSCAEPVLIFDAAGNKIFELESDLFQ